MSVYPTRHNFKNGRDTKNGKGPAGAKVNSVSPRRFIKGEYSLKHYKGKQSFFFFHLNLKTFLLVRHDVMSSDIKSPEQIVENLTDDLAFLPKCAIHGFLDI